MNIFIVVVDYINSDVLLKKDRNMCIDLLSTGEVRSCEWTFVYTSYVLVMLLGLNYFTLLVVQMILDV